LAKDSSINIQVYPPERGEYFEHEEFPIYDFDDTDIGTSILDHGHNFNGEDTKKRPKLWHNTIGYV